jgi:hypothetical protein
VRRSIHRTACITLLVHALALPAHAVDLYVDGTTGNDRNDGLTWATAKATIQAAVNRAGPSTIHIAAGTYRENLRFGNSRIALLGGYPPGGGARGLARHHTIVTDDDASSPTIWMFMVQDIVLDGLIIEDGFIEWGMPDGALGGGIYISASTNITLRNLVVRNNTTHTTCRVYRVSPFDCVTEEGRASLGGGLYAIRVDSLEIFNCLFTGNESTYTQEIDPSCEPMTCYNHASGDAMYLLESTVSLRHVTVSGNDGERDSASFEGFVEDGSLMRNSILYHEGGGLLWAARSEDVTYSNVPSGFVGGAGCISEDPMFRPGPLGDHYLAHVLTGDPTDSPCVEAGGDLATDVGLDGSTTRADEVPDAGVVDMGYHYPVLGSPREPDIRVARPTDTEIRILPGPGQVIDAVRGHVSRLADRGTHVDLGPVECLADDDTSRIVVDSLPPLDPPPGDIYFYLVRDEVSATYGHSTSGVERVPAVGDCP